MTLVELERRLDPAKFFRVHRGTLVNLGWISELHTDVAGQLVIRLREDTRHGAAGLAGPRARP